MKKITAFVIMTILMLPSLLMADVESPDDFELEATSSTIIVTWTANTNLEVDSYDDTEGYYIRWENDAGYEYSVKIDGVGSGEEEFIITGLDEGTSYDVTLTAYSGDVESSEKSDSITTDSVSIDDIDIVISGVDEITISIDAEGSNIDDYTVKVGTTSGGVEIYGSLTDPVQIDSDDSLVVNGLTVGTTYYVVLTALPDNTEFSAIPVVFESTHTFLSDAEDDIENGCFIDTTQQESLNVTLWFIMSSLGLLLISSRGIIRRSAPFLILILLIVSSESIAGDSLLYKNNFGIKGGLFLPNESDQKDVYEEIVPFSLFYERMFTENYSADIDLGYSSTDGTALQSSSSSTELVTELKMYPASVSINYNHEVAPYMTAYVGIGGDWWYVEEKSEIGEFDSDVIGWHAKTGLKIFSDELETFKQVGFLLDISYTEIDKFRSNDVDLGGWKFNIGLMYCL